MWEAKTCLKKKKPGESIQLGRSLGERDHDSSKKKDLHRGRGRVAGGKGKGEGWFQGK